MLGLLLAVVGLLPRFDDEVAAIAVVVVESSYPTRHGDVVVMFVVMIGAGAAGAAM